MSIAMNRRRMAGLTLVELMISIVLGLLITGAAISMFLSFGQTYTAAEGLSRVQENSRVAFELMARDLREAGTVPCSRYVPVVNVVNGADTQWWNTWGNGVFGYENGALSGSLAGTDALQTISGSSNAAFVANHDRVNAVFTVTPATHGFVAGDILMACDYRQGSIFQMTSGGGATIVHNNSGAPGNCSKGLGFKKPRDCSATGASYTYVDNSVLVQLQASRWYVAANGRGGNSLFRLALRGSAVGTAEEVVDGVDDMEVTFLVRGGTNYVAATSVPTAKWPDVSGVRIQLTFASVDRVSAGATNAPVTRTVAHTIALRSRNT